jgi:hypothetical protein
MFLAGASGSQRGTRAALVEERNREAVTLAALKVERAQVTAKGRQAETEAAPIRYVTCDLGVADQETAIRWLITLMVLTCDPLAIALRTAAASARRSCEALSLSPDTQCRLPTQVAAEYRAQPESNDTNRRYFVTFESRPARGLACSPAEPPFFEAPDTSRDPHSL